MDASKRAQLLHLQKQLAEEFVENLCVLVLVRGVLENGTPHYAYVRIRKDRYAAFKQAEATGAYDLRAYGEVLYHGEGLEPPEEIRTLLRAEYGAQEQFRENLATMLGGVADSLFHNETAPLPQTKPRS